MSTFPDSPIGIFDSGVGGLTVARAVADRLPRESFIYLGDTARVPYGNKSPATIQRYSETIAAMLVEQGCKALVIACNTASAYALSHLEAICDVPVIDVIRPAAATAAALTRAGSIGVIGTRGTVASRAYDDALTHIDANLRLTSVACPLFVPLAEEGWVEGDVPSSVARTYLSAFEDTDIDTLILGCTHYPLLTAVIEETICDAVGHPVTVLNSATATAEFLEQTLHSHDLHRDPEQPGQSLQRFWVTDASEAYAIACGRFFGAPVGSVHHVDLQPSGAPP